MTAVTATHVSGLHGAVHALDTLHGRMLRSAADDAGQVRLSVLNIVAACIDDRDSETAAETLTAIGARHPARVIVIRADPDAQDAAIEADVSLQRTPVGDHAVYTELIKLRVSGEPSFHLASVVTPLLIPDIPTDLWVVGAARLVQAFSDDAVAMCDRVIVDSDAYARPEEPLRLIAAELARRGEGLTVADVAWERARPWRELLAQAFSSGAADVAWLRAAAELRLECAGDRVPAQACLIAGWLASQLGWERGSEPLTLRLSPDGARRICRLDLRLERDGDNRRVTLADRGGAIHVVDEAPEGRVTRTVPDAPLTMTRLLARLLDESRVEPVYPRAVARAAAMLGRA